jgi:hypothetical protein
MVLSATQLDKVHANAEGTSKETAQQARKITARSHACGYFRRRLHALGMAMIGAAGLARVFYAARIGSSIENPVIAVNVEANRQALTLEQISHLDQQAFEHSLPQLRQALEKENPKDGADQQTLITIAGKLRRADETTPDYWPTILRFIPFASSRMAKNAPPPGQQTRVLSDILSVGLMRGIREVGKSILLDGGYLGNGEFTNCRIIFTQNPVRLTNAHFKNCVFEIPITDPPNAYIRRVSHILLSSNFSSVSIPTL